MSNVLIQTAESMTSWIFQGNPGTFRINDAVKNLEKTTWLVKVNQRKMRPGDIVYLWRSEHQNNPAGIIAKSKMVGVVTPMFSPPEVVQYWVDPNADNTREDRVWLEILEFCENDESMIERSEFLSSEILSSSLIIRQPNGTNYILSDLEAEIIDDIWASR